MIYTPIQHSDMSSEMESDREIYAIYTLIKHSDTIPDMDSDKQLYDIYTYTTV